MKITQKCVKLGSRGQFLAHTFLGHDDCLWKINLRNLWNGTMKNIRLRHGQCGSTIFLKNIFSRKLLENIRGLCWLFRLATLGQMFFFPEWTIKNSGLYRQSNLKAHVVPIIYFINQVIGTTILYNWKFYVYNFALR